MFREGSMFGFFFCIMKVFFVEFVVEFMRFIGSGLFLMLLLFCRGIDVVS